MSTVTLLLLLLTLSVSLCECRVHPTESNLEEKRNEFSYDGNKIPARDEASNQAKKVDAIRELIISGISSGFKAFRTLYHHGSSKGFNMKFKEMRSGSRHKLLGYFSNEGKKSTFHESRNVEELVEMDYAGAVRGPSVHNR